MKRASAKDMSIADVDFGRLDAEAETNLKTYFVDTGVLQKFRDGAKHYVLGRKGSGKTALFKSATPEVLRRDVIPIEFNDYPWETHKLIREGGLPSESAYVASWRFTFLAEICRHWMRAATTDELRREASRFLKQIYRDTEPGILEGLIDRAKRIRVLAGPEMTGVGSTGKVELEPAKHGSLLATAVSQWCRVLTDFVKRNFDSSPFTLKLDRLDDGWDASDESKQMLAGVLKAARDMNMALARSGQPAPVLTFLRSDIFNELQFNDKNKVSADVEALVWDEGNLVAVAETRIARSLDCPVGGAWKRVFSVDLMRGGASIQSYILKRTMGRPRDMIAFCLKCREVATAAHHAIVQTQDVYDAEQAFSEHVYNELDDEMHKQLPTSRAYLQTLRDVGRTRFSASDWIAAVKRRQTGATEEEALAHLKILFDYSIVGVPRSGGVTRGTTFQFIYGDRLLEPNFTQGIIVHPSLKKYLNLIEPRREQQTTDDEE